MEKLVRYIKAIQLELPKEVNGVEIPFELKDQHYLILENEESLVGYCLDFGSIAISILEEESDPINDILLKLIDMSILYISGLRKREALHLIYQNRIEDKEMWEAFEKLKELKTFKEFMDEL